MARVVFLQNIEWELWGTMSIVAVLKMHDHECKVLIGNDKEIINALREFPPDLIAFSCMSTLYDWVVYMSKRIKSLFPKSYIVVGGVHPTVCPEIIFNPFIDIVCRGEGEYSMLELANHIDSDKNITDIKGLWMKKNDEIFKNELRPEIEDINELPFADREIYKDYPFFKKNYLAYFIANRGCIFNCTYCFEPVYRDFYSNNGKHNPIRYRNIKALIFEIAYVLNKYNKKIVGFNDSLFTVNREWLELFCIEYQRKICLPFFCTTAIGLVNDAIIKLLKEANCIGVGFGIETGCESLRQGLLNKRFTNKRMEEAISILHKYKIKFFVTNMFCLPGETLSNALETIRINQRIRPDEVASFIYYPLPDTKLAEYALRNGFMDKEYFLDISKGAGLSLKRLKSILKGRNNSQIENLCKLSRIAIKYPLFLPLIKFLIKLPPNRFFDRIYLLSLILLSFRYRISDSSSKKFLFVIKSLIGLNDEEIWKGFFLMPKY